MLTGLRILTLPKYTMKCDCGTTMDISIDSKKIDQLENITCGTCKKIMYRDFGGINMRDTNNASNPKSDKHWKVGKTDEEISKVLTGEAQP